MGSPDLESHGHAKEAKNGNKDASQISYLRLLRENPSFFWATASYTASLIGEKVTYVASMSMLDIDNGTRMKVAWLFVCQMLPIFLVSPLGGYLSDKFDRRRLLILYNWCSTPIAVTFTVGYYLESQACLFLAASAQAMLYGLFEPCILSMTPLLVPEKYLPKAVTLVEVIYATIYSFAVSVGGMILAYTNAPVCFAVYWAMQVLSAGLLACNLQGNFCVCEQEDNAKVRPTPWTMARELAQFVWNHGPWVALKAMASILYIAVDLLNVDFSALDGHFHSARLSYMFCAGGIGSVLAPILAERFLPSNLRAWKVAIPFLLAGATLACWEMSQPSAFWEKTAWFSVLSSFTTALWLISALILQSTVPDAIMGRMLALDWGLEATSESTIVLVCGYLVDEEHMTAEAISRAIAMLGAAFTVGWFLIVHMPRGTKWFFGS